MKKAKKAKKTKKTKPRGDFELLRVLGHEDGTFTVDVPGGWRDDPGRAERLCSAVAEAVAKVLSDSDKASVREFGRLNRP